jgi:hypothetical protein
VADFLMTAPPFFRWVTWAGNNAPRVFQAVDSAGAAQTLAGAVIVLTVTWSGGSLTLRSGTDPELVLWDQSDPAEVGMWSVAFTLAQTRAFPLNTPMVFEFERWLDGVQTTLLRGELIAQTGNNTDV